VIVLSCSDISKYYGNEMILNNININIAKGDKVALIGDNGSGKTTLFKILTGNLNYDEGSIFLAKDITIGYLEQVQAVDEDQNILDTCKPIFQDVIDMEKELRKMEEDIANHKDHSSREFENLMNQYSHNLEDFKDKNGYGYMSLIKGVLNGLSFSEADLDKKIKHLSGGQRSRLNIALLLLKKPDILFLDEPTNHLDLNAIKWLEEFIISYPGTVITISHDRYFINRTSNRVIEIINKSMLTFNGNYDDYLIYKDEYISNLQKQYDSQQREIKKQKELITKFKERGTEKLAKRARSREKRLDMIEEIEMPEFRSFEAKISLKASNPSGQDVLFMKNIGMSYGDKMIFENASGNIYKGEKIGLIGPNGVGKTTLFKILLEQINQYEGELKFGHNVLPGYYDQEQENLNPLNNLLDEIQEENPKLDYGDIRSLLAKLLFFGEDVYKLVKNLSGGEKGKLSLLKLMLSKSNFLLLDEPTNHLDISSKDVLENALIEYDGTLLIISHDRYFVNRVCDKIFELSPNGIKEYLGNYDYYLEKVSEENQPEESQEKEKTKTQIKEERKREREERNQKKKIKKRYEEVEALIKETETTIHTLEEEMCKEEVYSDPEKSRKIHSKQDKLQSELEELYEEWEELLSQME
jgi:ATP-binding cassette subfamily F protein 3